MILENTVHILTTNDEFPTNKLLLSAFVALGQKVSFINPYLNTMLISAQQTELKAPAIVINRCGGLNFDDIDILMSKQFAISGSRVFNPPEDLLNFRNKELQLQLLQTLSFPIIPTLISRGPNLDEERLREVLVPFQSTNGFIFKNSRGQGGKGVIRLQSQVALQDLVETRHLMRDERYLIQPFLNVKKEYRIYFVGNKMMGAIAKVAKSSGENDQKLNLHNTHFKDIETSNLPTLITDFLPHMQSLPLNLYCCDWLETVDNQLYLLEVNTLNGFSAIEGKINLIANSILNYRN